MLLEGRAVMHLFTLLLQLLIYCLICAHHKLGAVPRHLRTENFGWIICCTTYSVIVLKAVFEIFYLLLLGGKGSILEWVCVCLPVTEIVIFGMCCCRPRDY